MTTPAPLAERLEEIRARRYLSYADVQQALDEALRILSRLGDEKVIEAAAKGAYNHGASEIDPDWEDQEQWIKNDLWIAPQRAALAAAVAAATEE